VKGRRLEMTKNPLIHPFLLAAFPVLFLFVHNAEEVTAHQTLVPAAVVMSATLLMLLLLLLVLKDITKAAIVVSAFVILFFSWGRVFDAVESWRVGGFVMGRENYLLILWGLLFVYIVYLVLRSRRNLGNLTKVLNAISVALVTVSLFDVAVYRWEARPLCVWAKWRASWRIGSQNEERKRELPKSVDLYQ
jgi:hypothetical protein